jgi:hypothetical protein
MFIMAILAILYLCAVDQSMALGTFGLGAVLEMAESAAFIVFATF